MDVTEQKPVVTGLEKPFVIGLDLGGTNAVFGVVDQRGQVLATNSIKTQAYKTVDDFVEAGVEAIRPLVAKYGGIGQFRAMGIGAPNGNFYRGTIEFAPNLSWGHDGVVPLGEMFSQKLGIPVGLTNRCERCCYRRDAVWCGTWLEGFHHDYPRYRRRFRYCC